MVSLYFERLYPQENPNNEIEEYLNNIYVAINKKRAESKYKVALIAQP